MTHRTFDEQIANFNRVVSSWDINQEYKVALLGMIASLGYEHEKSITPEPHWIPVTERLPEYGKGVLTITQEDDVYEVNHIIDEEHGEWFWEDNGKVIAWCELPEPYKPTVPPECEGDCGWCKTSVIEKCKGVTE